MPVGNALAQAVHAAGESSPGPTIPSDTHAVVLKATEMQLLALEQELLCLGVPHRAIREPDAPYLGAITAIGVCPQPRTGALRKLFRGFSLYK